MNTVIKLENISKRYRLGLVGTNTLKGDLQAWWYRVRGLPDPTLIIGEENRLDSVGGDYIWALKDINFEVKQGEVLGIIGKNGAGKSTLLKILSRVTVPTTGSIKVKGRIASLLEVGTGFHGELTGRENIYLNGAILGMRKPEITRKFDEIIDFAGIAKYIDTPVKRYSSGMYVRLGFAVAAHLEPEILIVDEVLAVGDAEFQKKAIGKMQDVSTNEGRTVLFVSHNMASVQKLCTRGVLLENGGVSFEGNVVGVVNQYMKIHNFLAPRHTWKNMITNEFSFIEAQAHDENFKIKNNLDITKKIGITLIYDVLKNEIKHTHGINVYTQTGVHVISTHNLNYLNNSDERKGGRYKVTAWIPENFLSEGSFIVGIAVFCPNPFHIYKNFNELLYFSTVDYERGDSAKGLYKGSMPGLIRPILNWQSSKQ